MNTADRLDQLAPLPTNEIVEQAWLRLASPELSNGHPGNTYAPEVLLLVRWLAVRPGGICYRIAAAHETDAATISSRLKRMRTHGLAVRDDVGRWSLTADGLAFRDLIDVKGVL